MSTYDVSTPWALLGAAIGAGGILAVHFIFGTSWHMAAAGGGTLLVAYIIGAIAAGNAVGEVSRGVMLGANSALNWAVSYLILNLIFAHFAPHAVVHPPPPHHPAVAAAPAFFPAALGISIGLGALNFIGVFSVISRFVAYQVLIGYGNWVLPMSWPIVAIGFTFFLLELLGGLCIGLPGVDFFALKDFNLDAKTGTVFLKGGWIANLNHYHTAFNMGNFGFIDAKNQGIVLDHEAGHSLNLAVFGSLFHLVGTIDENAIQGGEALAEMLAESNVATTSRSTLGMWADHTAGTPAST